MIECAEFVLVEPRRIDTPPGVGITSIKSTAKGLQPDDQVVSIGATGDHWFEGTHCHKSGCKSLRFRHGTILCEAHWIYWSGGNGIEAGFETLREWCAVPGEEIDRICTGCRHPDGLHPDGGVCWALSDEGDRNGCNCQGFVAKAAKEHCGGEPGEGAGGAGLGEDRVKLRQMRRCRCGHPYSEHVDDDDLARCLDCLCDRFVEVDDHETDALKRIQSALTGLDAAACARVLDYFVARYGQRGRS